ncbi:alpha-hydroxy-acid oxidizing protein [Nocardia sp. NPDC101769]|uniref:alpha-hydroxy-acid oxidizing protein n=1 Tax=Nocardia sp. NPDC101769 TaxID=3364333 RepID=UPI00381B3989
MAENRDYFATFHEEIRRAAKTSAPVLPLAAAELERLAATTLDPALFSYVAGGAGAERTAAANLEAFARRRIVPRMLRGTAAPTGRDLSVEVLGTRLAAPVLTAPVGALEVLHTRGEVAVAEVARELGIGTVLSTVASSTIEEVGAVAGQNWWYQLYWPAEESVAKSLVQRAAKAGAKAVVITVDTPTIGWRPREISSETTPILRGYGIANYLSDPVFRSILAEPPEAGTDAHQAAMAAVSAMFGNHTIRAADIGRVRDWTDLPIVAKGVLHPDDARSLVAAGADGIVVSNHGGRQVDGAVAALDTLASIVAAVGDRADVLFDSGVRTGTDVLIAIALGAKAVLYGRPWVYGLGLAGKAGVRHALRLLLADFDITMGLVGCATPADIDESLIHPHRY